MENIIIYIDGSSKGNPGDGGIGIVIIKDNNILYKISQYIGESVTNNVAEYTALIEALKFANLKGYKEFEIYSDSELLVKQINDEYKIKNPNLIPYYKKAKDLINQFDKVTIKHINRNSDRIAIMADNLAQKGVLYKQEIMTLKEFLYNIKENEIIEKSSWGWGNAVKNLTTIPKELKSLAKEMVKYKNAEDFAENLPHEKWRNFVITCFIPNHYDQVIYEIYSAIFHTRFPSEYRNEALPILQHFYNLAVKENLN